jgi:hypothetical protein
MIRSIVGVIPQSLQVQAQVTSRLMSRVGERGKTSACVSVCFCGRSGAGVIFVCLRNSCYHVTELGGPSGL